jgi:hypothetical protein
MKYKTYDYDKDEAKITQLANRVAVTISKRFTRLKPSVSLVDPQKRLEEDLQVIFKNLKVLLSNFLILFNKN